MQSRGADAGVCMYARMSAQLIDAFPEFELDMRWDGTVLRCSFCTGYVLYCTYSYLFASRENQYIENVV